MLSEKLVICAFLKGHKVPNYDIATLFESGINIAWFENAIYQKIFEVCDIYKNSNRKWDEGLVLEYLKKCNVKNPQDIILELSSLPLTPQDIIIEHIYKLKNNYSYKQLKELSFAIQKECDKKEDVQKIVTLAENSLKDFNFLGSYGYSKNLATIRQERQKDPEVKRIKTHIPFIDTVLTDDDGNSGILSENLFYISGLKESGKTFVLTKIVENVSREHKVLFGSMEFGKKLYDKNIQKAQDKKCFDGVLENIFVFDDIYDVDMIIAEIRYQKKVNDIKVVALDSMLRMTNANSPFVTNEERLSSMFSKLGKVSKELQVPIFIIVQSAKEDLKSSMVSVKGAINADHEAFWWIHLFKTFFKDYENEQRTVLWVKNKDTHKHPKQHLMFVPQTSDFYRCEVDEKGVACGAIDKYRVPKIATEVYYNDERVDIPVL